MLAGGLTYCPWCAAGCKCGRQIMTEGTCVLCGHGDVHPRPGARPVTGVAFYGTMSRVHRAVARLNRKPRPAVGRPRPRLSRVDTVNQILAARRDLGWS